MTSDGRLAACAGTEVEHVNDLYSPDLFQEPIHRLGQIDPADGDQMND